MLTSVIDLCSRLIINYNSTEHQSELTQASFTVSLKQFVSDLLLFVIKIQYFVLISMRKLEYNYFCVVLISFLLYLFRRVYLYILTLFWLGFWLDAQWLRGRG